MRSRREHLGKRVLILAGVAAAAIVSGPQVAGAAGAGAQSFTQHLHQGTDISYDYHTCATPPVPEQITMSNENGVFHVTQLANGTFWGTGTFEGDFVERPITNQLLAVPDGHGGTNLVPDGTVTFDTSKPTYTGHFTVWFGDNNNLQNGTETSTFSARGTGSDGSVITIHEVAHMSVSATGVQSVTFDKLSC